MTATSSTAGFNSDHGAPKSMAANPTLPKCSVNTIAKLLNITERRVQQLAKEGVIPKPIKGEYDLVGSVQGYVTYLQEKVKGADIAASRRTFEQERIRKIRMENDEREGRLLQFDDVKNALNEMMVLLRGQLESIPGRVASELAGVSDAGVIRHTLLNEIRRTESTAAEQLAGMGVDQASIKPDKPTTTKKSGAVGKRKKKAARRKRGARAVQK